MPQSDLETVIRSGSGRKIACETVIDGDPPPEKVEIPDNPPDFPAESFYLSKEDELDWFDRNAVYDRKDSWNANFNTNSNSNSNSQRFSLNLKSNASIIGLPKPQKICFVISKLRKNCKQPTARFFPKRSQSSRKSADSVSEPSSPKVSCIGRVRSKKERSLRRINRCRSKKTSTVSGPEKTGFWSCFKDAFRFGCRKNQAVDVAETSRESPPQKSMTGEKRKKSSTDPVSDPTGLSGVKRFASARRSESWVGCDVDLEVSASDSRDRGLV